MLTLAEMDSTLQIEYELRLEAMSEEALRALLADTAALRGLIPGHLSDADGRRIAEATLAELIARNTAEDEPPAPAEPQSAWAQLLTLFWIPYR